MTAGAPPRWIEFGTIARAHGVRGEVRLVPMHPDDELPERVERVRLVGRHGGEKVLSLSSVRPTNGALLVLFEGIADRDAAQALAGARLSIDAADLPPAEPGEIYLYELTGAAATDAAGVTIGVIEGLVDNHGQDVLVLRGPGGDERLVPLTEQTLVSFDRATRRVTLEVPEGLFD